MTGIPSTNLPRFAKTLTGRAESNLRLIVDQVLLISKIGIKVFCVSITDCASRKLVIGFPLQLLNHSVTTTALPYSPLDFVTAR